jgi:conjugative transfer signal peptidase TraF
MTRFKGRVAVAAVVGLSLLALKPLINSAPLLVWNATESVPKGWYLISKRQPKIGEIALIKPPDWIELYASERGYLPRDIWLLKPIFASGPAIVCRFASHVFVNGKRVARAKRLDGKLRQLPVWRGCKSLARTQYFVLGHHRESFDSRYFGAVERDQVAGTAHPFPGLLK